MSAATLLAHYQLTVADARAFIFSNLGNPGLIFNVVTSYGIDAQILAEIVGGGFSADDVVGFFNAQGLNGNLLLPSPSPISTPQTAAELLAPYNISVAQARDFVFSNLATPALIYNVARQYGIHSDALAEIVGGGFSGSDVVGFFDTQGLDGRQLLPVLDAVAVFMRGTSVGYLNSQSAIEVQLPQPLKISDLLNLENYRSDSGAFGANAQVVAMGQAGDTAGHASYVRIATGSGVTLTPGDTSVTLIAENAAGQGRQVVFKLPQVRLDGTTSDDTLYATANDEMISLSAGGNDRVVLQLPDESSDLIYDFTPQQGTDADVLDLRAFGLTGIAGTQPAVPTAQFVAAIHSHATSPIDISGQLVLVVNSGANMGPGLLASMLFGENKPLLLGPGSAAVVMVFESSDNFDDLYYVRNTSSTPAPDLIATSLGQIKLTGAYTPGAGTYTENSFTTDSFLI